MHVVERSAGFVIYHDDGDGDLTYLLLDYGQHWDYPKGHVEPGESDLDAALRELREETAISDAVIVDSFAREIGYFFRHKKRGMVQKTVVFFLASTPTRVVRLSSEHSGHEFLAFEHAMERLTFANARQLLREAHAHLMDHRRAGGT
jgi:8-oxo-dGTP pyrophosphatase MutT (NUDIX family)